ncbi:protein kinase domain-containing protein [Rhodococcus koreensis]|jgi:non-specific serine/threonine protein kinase|uniref:protein kinase domain-containing protein n=1 Tax=Rhodococcus koreensis TaxID=99653 RepID=UPI001980A496|nr:protein kinase [Rhodococcus koreensis]QSE81180.1 protein kinase [Rhodococcus koreensis]
MSGIDPFETQRDVVLPITTELEACGFDDAQEIGRGGFGVVYRCRQSVLDRTVAVKVLTTDLDEENHERFLREQRAMGRLTGHPNVVNILQVGATESGRPYLVMPYHPHDSLDGEIRRHGPLAVEEVLKLGVKTAGALETAHRLGILHRDVKPANILLTEYGEPALTDFGIAHFAGGFETATGVVTGSPAFTAPEVLAGQTPSPAADVYGLAATLFCALTGHAAFERRSGEQLMAQFVRITSHPPPDPREHGVPDDLSAVVERAMSQDPEIRPTAMELGDELQEVELRHGLPLDEMPVRPVADRRPSLTPNSRAKAPSGADPGRPLAGNLPVALTSFVGRRSDLAEAKNQLKVSRLVTLTGIGGVGKTRLALKAAAQSDRAFPDGVWLAELGELRDESLLVDVVTGALGLREQSARPVQDLLVEFLGSKRMLLVLDNCEQLVDAVAKLVEILLRSCPELRILATSREALAIGGEAVLRVPPLTVPESDRPSSSRSMPRSDAVRLFVERAAAAVPGFELNDSNRAAVAGICRKLDGLPLPIELAAARLRAMSPEQILRRLTDRYELLTGGTRSAPTRQQTLRLCIDWSYELCTTPEQLAWERLAIFAGSFELDAAEEICGFDLSPSGVVDVVTSLLDKSILIREESGPVVRFRMLETLRGFGAEKAQESGRYRDLRVRHRDWYRRLAEDANTQWIGDRQLEWFQRIEREQPNLREAMEFCASEDPVIGLTIASALFQFWNSRSLFSEGRYWLDRILDRHSGQPTIERVEALYADSVLAEMQGDLSVAARLVAQALQLAEQTQDSTIDSLAAHAEGLCALFSGDLPKACSRLEASVSAFVDPRDLSLRLEALMSLGIAYEWRGDTDLAISRFEEVHEITRSRGESVLQAYSLWALGVAWWRRGEPRRATEQLERGLRLAQVANDQVGATTCLETLAWIAASDEEPRRAAVLMGAAEVLSRAVGSSSAYLPNLLDYHNDCERRARQALGTKTFEAARHEGNALDLDASVTFALNRQSSDQAGKIPKPSLLTKREHEVAELVARGLTNKAIAAELGISPRTVQGHVEHILTKLGFTSRVQIAAWMVEQINEI